MSVQALVPSANDLFARLSRIPLKGYLSDPRKTACSRVCGRPRSSNASVGMVKVPETMGPSIPDHTKERPVFVDLHFWTSMVEFGAVKDLTAKERRKRGGELDVSFLPPQRDWPRGHAPSSKFPNVAWPSARIGTVWSTCMAEGDVAKERRGLKEEREDR